MEVCFLHGLDSSPRGTKGSLLRRHYPRAVTPELPPGITERLKTAERVLAGGGPYLLVGTSLGGLTALQYAMAHPGGVGGLVLMAPAVGSNVKGLFPEEEQETMARTFIPEGVPAVIIHGKRDAVIPLSAVRALVDRSPDRRAIELLEVDDDHDLHGSLDLMLGAVAGLLKRVGEEAGKAWS